MTSKQIGYIVSILLLIGVFNLPIGYYTLLRICVTGICTYYLREEVNKNNTKTNTSIILLGVLVILFNPIIPIYLNKGIWIIIDLLSAIAITYYVFQLKK